MNHFSSEGNYNGDTETQDEREGEMKLNEAVSERLKELLAQKQMTNYALFKRCGVPKSTIGNLVNCTYNSVALRVLHELCQGLGVSLTEFFDSPLFDEDNLEP